LKSVTTRSSRGPKDLRIAYLTNWLSPHSQPLWEQISHGVKYLRVFVSAESDLQHKFPKVNTHIDVQLQRSINRFRFYIKYYGSWESEDFHIPYDTYHQLKTYRPDLIISGQFGLRTALSVLYRLCHPDTRMILSAPLSCRSERHRGWLRIWLRKWILRHIDAAFVNGQSGEEYLRGLGYKGRLTHIPYTVDGTHFANKCYDPHPNHMRLLFTGRLVPQKGLRTFCAVLDRWCADHPEITVRMRFIGEGREEEFLRTVPTHSNLTIEVFGKVSQSELREHYEQSDIFVLPSLSDEWAVVTNEAMNAGVPVLGSVQAQSVLELVREGKNGWQFDLLSEQSTYDGFSRALLTPVQRLHAMSVEAFKTSEAFAPPRIAERALALMESLYRNETQYGPAPVDATSHSSLPSASIGVGEI
jgi:glycosyltransferase involved in cell wall biosynthesis